MNLKNALTRRYYDWRLSSTAKSVMKQRLSYLSAKKLLNLERCLRKIEAKGVAGDCLEFGVALGGSAILIAKQMDSGRCFAGYDVFGLIPPPSERDGRDAHKRYEAIAAGNSGGIGGDLYYGYEKDLLSKVKANFAAFGVAVDGQRIRLVQGFFEDTVPLDNGHAIAFAHIDCDWFDPVTVCLERTYKNLSRGGIVVLDDYNDYGGCKKATDAFLERYPNMRLIDSSCNAILQRQQ